MNSKELAEFVDDQLSGLDGIRKIPMMGGWIFYCQEKIFGGIYEPGFMVKNTATARAAMPDSEPEPPYSGAKPMLPVTILEDREQLQAMVRAMLPELPERKPRRTKISGKQ